MKTDLASKSATAAFVETQVSITEGGAATLAVALSEKQDEDVTLDVALSSSRNDVLTDFLPVSASIVIPAGDLTTTIAISSVDDTTMEIDEPFTLAITSSSPNVKVANSQLTVVVIDDDVPSATLAVAGTDLLENSSGTTFTITLDRAPVKTAIVDVSFTGTSTIASDFLVTPSLGSEVTFAAGETAKTFTITPIDDTLDDDAETIILSLSSPSSVEVGTPSSATINLREFNLDLNFAGQFNDGSTLSSRGGHFTNTNFSRASTATYVDADGIIKTAAAGVPRFNHDPMTGQPRGMLIEMTQVNLVPWSEDFSTGWTLSEILPFGSGSSTDITSLRTPANGLNADLITESTANSTHQISRSFNPSGSNAFAFSIFAKPNGRTKLRLTIHRSANAADFITMDCPLDGTQVVTKSAGGTGSLASAEVEQYKNGWYRCHLSGKGSGTSGTHVFTIGLVDSLGNTSYTGDGTSGLYVWGVNVNYHSLFVGFPHSSYIPTSGATVSRSVDISNIPTASFLSTSGGSFFTEFALEGFSTSTIYSALLTLDDGTSSNYLTLFPRTSSLTSQIRQTAGGTNTINQFGTGAVLTQLFAPNRMTIGFSPTAYDAYFNDTYSIASATGVSMLGAATSLRFGSNPITSNYCLKGDIARVSYSKFRAPNATLEDWSNTSAFFRKITPTVRLAQANLSALESDGPTSFIIGLTEKSSTSVTVQYALTGTATNAVDFTTSAVTGTITFAPGELRKIVTIAPISDGLVEGSETVILTLSAPSGATLGSVPVSTMTISD